MKKVQFPDISATDFIEAFRQPEWGQHPYSPEQQDDVLQAHLSGENGLIKRVVRSQKFSFGDARSFWPDEKRGSFVELVETCREFIVNGIDVLPFDECWFEWSLSLVSNNTKFICVMNKDADGIEFVPFARQENFDGTGWLDNWIFSGWKQKFLYDGSLMTSPFVTTDKTNAMQEQDNGIRAISMAFMAMLLSRETKIVEKRPPSGLVRHRLKKGKVPLFSHKVVTINPQRIVYEGSGQSSGIKRSSPRLHWRRGHVRTLGSGKKIGIPPCIIGAAENGILDKTYRVRPKPEDMHDSR